jgi:hypothetical protein
MFLPEQDRVQLRQGDIVFGLFYPILNCTNLFLIGRAMPTAPDDPCDISPLTVQTKPYGNTLTAQINVVRSHSIVLSQCCDLELRDGRLSSPAFVVSPLTPVPYTIRTNALNLERLQRNSLTDYSSLYYIRAQAPLIEDCMVDFSTVASVTNKDYSLALSGKVLQMTDAERVRFKTKLAAHFGRPTEEEIQAGLFPTP